MTGVAVAKISLVAAVLQALDAGALDGWRSNLAGMDGSA